MSATKNECEIVNRLSRKVEKELSDNMTEVNASLAEINEKLEDVAEINSFTLLTTDWIINSDVSTSTDYPFICTKTSDKFSNTSKPIYQILGAGNIPTVEELTEAGYISVVNFNSSSVTLYATEKPLNTLTLVVKGV